MGILDVALYNSVFVHFFFKFIKTIKYISFKWEIVKLRKDFIGPGDYCMFIKYRNTILSHILLSILVIGRWSHDADIRRSKLTLVPWKNMGRKLKNDWMKGCIFKRWAISQILSDYLPPCLNMCFIVLWIIKMDAISERK